MSFRKLKHQPTHVISRAVDEKKIFETENDCCRFLFQLFAANIGRPALNLRRKDVNQAVGDLLQGKDVSDRFIIKEYTPLVSIFDFALVVNHFHLYLVANIENGIPLFMQKLNTGFAKYFNLKYTRKGSLFGGRYKSIIVKTDFQSQALSRYISIINPLDVYQPGWRENGLDNKEKAFVFLKNYPFSSFPERVGERVSRITASIEILHKYNLEKNRKDHAQFVRDFLEERLSIFQNVFID